MNRSNITPTPSIRIIVAVLAHLIVQVNADDAGEYTIGGLHDLDKGWMREVEQ